jgi:hypothetical protein
MEKEEKLKIIIKSNNINEKIKYELLINNALRLYCSNLTQKEEEIRQNKHLYKNPEKLLEKYENDIKQTWELIKKMW